MTTANIYLNFNGNCEAAFNYYKSVFGGEFEYISRFSEIPESENYQVPDADKDKIMHVSLVVGNTYLMGSDVGSHWAPDFIQGNNFSISINTKNKEEADSLFLHLGEGGQVTMPLENTFWSDYFGMLTDKFGINWMISFNEKQNQ
jgi:PhnB protein